MFENRRWLVIPTSIIDTIDFNQVQQFGEDSLRLSIDESETFVKYDIVDVTESYDTTFTDPETDDDVTTTTNAGIYGRPSIYSSSYGEYTHTEILNILTGSNWSTPIEGE